MTSPIPLRDPGAPGSSAPGCPHAPTCPGCPLINEPYARGLELKAERLERALLGYPELAGARIEPLAGADVITQYRLRAKLVVDAQGRLGLFEAGRHDVVDIPGCRILEPALLSVASALRGLLPLGLPLRGVDLRRVDRGVLVCLIVEGRPAAGEIEAACERARRGVPHLAGLAVSFARPDAVQLLGPEQKILQGADAEPHHLSPGAPWHYASHGAFTQVHAGQTARLHECIERLATEKLGTLSGRRVLELYAGSGALALRLAAGGADVTAVESFAPALERLSRAASAQSLRVETCAADAERYLRELTARAPAPFDLVLVNPPRRGLAPGVRSALAALAPRAAVYVSCEPETLARDLSHLASLGWGATKLRGFDMIPLSDAVEAVVLLEPERTPAPRVLFEDERSLALFKAPFESTAGEGGPGPSLLDRARLGLGVGELTPLYRLEVGTSGVCWFARRAADVEALTRSLEGGSLTYTALAMGVSHKKGKVARPLRVKRQLLEAVTRYTRDAVVNGHSLLELRPEQRKKHQLHRHLASIGHPILGDAEHGHAAANRHFEHRHGLDRPFLHCTSLRLELPAGPVEIRAELPGDLAAVLASLRRGGEARG